MSVNTFDLPYRATQVRGALLFLRRWLAHPLRVGSVLPSSPELARLIASHAVIHDDEAILELGAGTGAITEALLEAGLPEDRLILVELDRELHHWLSLRYPEAEVIHGNAAELRTLLPPFWTGRISMVVSSLPMLCFPPALQQAIAEQCFDVMSEDGRLLQYTYSPLSPLTLGMGLSGQRLGKVGGNLPPAALWRFTRTGGICP
jgi:phosphatidylethanolamine/phosphatidyl-N-methylethanolamine N-methyltransferase